jgi:hypothetical protein
VSVVYAFGQRCNFVYDFGKRFYRLHRESMTIRIVLADDHGVARNRLRNFLAFDPDLEVIGEVLCYNVIVCQQWPGAAQAGFDSPGVARPR